MLKIWNSKLHELNDLLNCLEGSLDRMWKIAVRYPIDQDCFCYDCLVGMLMRKHIDIQRERKAKVERDLRKFLWLKNKTLGKDSGSELNVEKAREFPIGDLLTNEPSGRNSNRVFYRCELHNEKTPSFVWYKEKNRYKCFGCEKFGDVINLYQELNGCDFKESVKFLQNN